ncbi:hypothetical protein B0H34DRAFT_801799 [Crassisporium funariophilum]|nr:hypothetical protein B0H34DRAFT_801799 [Crassisporium funariophilum]
MPTSLAFNDNLRSLASSSPFPSIGVPELHPHSDPRMKLGDSQVHASVDGHSSSRASLQTSDDELHRSGREDADVLLHQNGLTGESLHARVPSETYNDRHYLDNGDLNALSDGNYDYPVEIEDDNGLYTRSIVDEEAMLFGRDVWDEIQGPGLYADEFALHEEEGTLHAHYFDADDLYGRSVSADFDVSIIGGEVEFQVRVEDWNFDVSEDVHGVQEAVPQDVGDDLQERNFYTPSEGRFHESMRSSSGNFGVDVRNAEEVAHANNTDNLLCDESSLLKAYPSWRSSPFVNRFIVPYDRRRE